MMLSRRALIGSTLAGSAVSGFSLGTAFGASTVRPDTRTIRPDRFIVDAALTGAAEMIANLTGDRTVVHVFSGDPGSVWMHTLEPALRRRPQMIAGFTSAPTLFCLQYLARDYGLALRAHSDEAAMSVLIDLHTLNQSGPVSWVLAPKKR